MFAPLWTSLSVRALSNNNNNSQRVITACSQSKVKGPSVNVLRWGAVAWHIKLMILFMFLSFVERDIHLVHSSFSRTHRHTSGVKTHRHVWHYKLLTELNWEDISDKWGDGSGNVDHHESSDRNTNDLFIHNIRLEQLTCRPRGAND